MSTAQNFGEFFRENRKALGITLREFCRRNGFDPGNVSRIERSIVPPPQSVQLLESYAKALKLDSGTVGWERFVALAATEAGRIPADVLENEQASAKLQGLFETARGKGHRRWVSALDLERWADTEAARNTLPELVRRLVRATGKDIKAMEFPAHEQVQRPGWDGIIEAGDADAYVPAGISGWEMGVTKNAETKAKEDFDKRMKDPCGLARENTTFVFVTLRKWQKKAAWRQAKEALGVWKAVRVYDSASLEEWLEQAPAVDAWLARFVGNKPIGVVSIDEYWANLQAVTDPSLAPGVFLASREEQMKQLERWLAGPPGAILVEARSPVEAIDFVAAFSRDPERGKCFENALVIETREAWRDVAAAAGAGLLLIAHPSLTIEPELVAQVVRQGHRVLISSNQAPREQVECLQLQRAFREDVEQSLRESGVKDAKASRFARESGGSLTVLKRLLGRYPGTAEPEWSRPAEAPALVPMLLAGSWDETSEGDRSAIERISAQPYSAAAATAARWLKGADSPLTRNGSRWGLVSRDDSWFFLAKVLTPNDLERFEAVALDVLSDDDTALELSADERWQARLQRKMPTYSSALRNGTAETLALLAARPEGLPQAHDIVGRVDHLVRQLLSGKGRLRWLSISDQLPLLAEAGPDAFLTAVERALRRESPELLTLFEQVGLTGWPSLQHARLLSALEGLGWNRAFLPRVSLILAGLDELLPSVKTGSSPLRSLTEIFMPWRPQTTAPVEERIKVLTKVIHSRLEAGWRLLSGLLLNQQHFSMDIHRPLWRDWALGRSATTPTVDYWKQARACASLLIEHAGDDIERWKALIQQFEHLPGPAQKVFLERLSGLAERDLDEETRRVVSEMLREKVSLHRKFADTEWALEANMVEELERVGHLFEPEDAVRRNAWLFRSRWQLWETPGAETERFENRCPDALREILGTGGWKEVLRLVELADAPEEVGAVLAEIDAGENERNVLPGLLLAAGENAPRCAGGYVRRRFQRDGWDWVHRVDMRGWSEAEVARFLVWLPFERKTWELVAARGNAVAVPYWKRAWPYTQGLDARDATYAVERFLKCGNSSAAFIVLQMALHQRTVLEPSLLMDALESWLKSATEETAHQGARYQIPLFFQELQRGIAENDPKVDLDRLGKLEWAYLGLLDGHPASPITLHGKLRDEPEFFIDVLELVFPSKNETDRSAKEITEKESQRAQNAYRLLRSWDQVPGGRAGQDIDEKALFKWVERARTLAADRGLLEICESRIGEVFAYAPEEDDGSWPCVPVRDALEDIGTDEVMGGFSAGIYNRRGVFSKSMREGGMQERALAEKYGKFADACKIEWPQTAAALRRIAQGYEEDARREDAQALLDQ